jgi:hypothetical protein
MTTALEGLREEEVFPVVFKSGHNERRDFYDRNIHELILATGWSKVHRKTIHGGVLEWPRFDRIFFLEFPFSYSRSSNRYYLQNARIYPGRIEVLTCPKPHRCAVLDLGPENPYRERPSKKNYRVASQGMELLIEETCACFTGDEHDHEGSVFLYRWK